MKSDLSKLKVGDSIWTIQEGNTKVVDIVKNDDYPIKTKKGSGLTLDGKYFNTDLYPSAFLTNPFEVRNILVGTDGVNYTERKGIIIDNVICVESVWKYAKEIENPTVTELTLEQIADKFGVDVNTLKIKK